MSKSRAAQTSYGFSAAIIALVLYFAVFNPAALSPTWVTLIGLLLTAVKTLLGLKEKKEDEDDGSNTEPSAEAA